MTNRSVLSNYRIYIASSCIIFLCPQAMAQTYAATLQWSKRVELSTPVSGVVKEVSAQVGEKVAKGTVLLRLDDEVFSARLQAAQAALSNQEEQAKEAQRELERTTELYNRTLLSEHDLQVAKNNQVQASAELQRARAAVTLAKNNLFYSKLRAPFNAWVLSRQAEPGKVVSAELNPEALFVVAEADHMTALIYVDENNLAGLKNGAAAKVKIDKQEFVGSIKSIGLEPGKNPAEGVRYPVSVEFATNNQLLRAGQQASVVLP
ncbi:MAG: efflux RND transporter periplasmic adaptor subunit [Gammaproteobacteria bacterium]|nr:efflux RND transporter periplasmic adaptor subunit [Gammaproteobacteria bacterium]